MKQEDKMYDTQLDVSVAAKQEKETSRETEGLEGLMKNGSKRTERGLKVDISIPEECSPLYSNADLDYKKNEDEPTVASRDFKTVEKGPKSSPKLAGMPNIRDLDLGNGKIFALIESGDYTGVERFLAERGHKVIITPKIGCSPIHYSKLNLANCENENEDSPLIMAAKIDCKMVQIVIKYGGNPNHANKDRDTPLSIAANRSDRDTIDLLLLAGGNLRAAVVKLTSALRYISEKQLKESTRAGFSVRPLTILLADDVYLKCRDPIKTAFDVCKDIEHIKDVRDEFKIEFELLMRDADLFAYKFLNHCDKMFEAREILTSSINLLTTAIDRSKKKFVSHPFSQQIINERWFGETSNRLLFGKTLITFKYLTSPIVLPLLFLKFLFIDICRGICFMESSFADLLRLLFVPCLCFTTDAINYIGFMAVMVSTCLIPFGAGTYEVTPIEYVLYYCVFARILIEVDHLIQQTWKRYFRNFWNFVDLSVIILLVVAAIYKGSIKYIIDRQQNIIAETEIAFNNTWYADQEDILINQHDNSMNVNFIYAVAEFILTIRLLSLLEIHKSLGTMLIALKYLVADVMKFGVILLTIILGTSVAIFSMTIALQEWNQELETISKVYVWPEGLPKKLPDVTDISNKIKIPDVFATFSDTLRNILWGTFGLLDVVVGYII